MTYTVIFDSNGGTGTMPSQSIEVDVDTALALNTFTKENSTFMGWGTTAGGPVEYTDGETVRNLADEGESITLYAQWRGAFGIDIQRNNSENNKLHKSIDTLLHVTGTLKASTSIIDPTFIIACDLEAVTGANYISVPVFGRSYYIKDIVSYANGLVGFSCHVDALSSFAAEIEANKGIVRRGESRDTYNLYINDGSLVSYQNPYVLTEPFPSGFTGASFVLATAGHAGP